MARLVTWGAELGQTALSGTVEAAYSSGSGGTTQIQSTIKRSGTYALRAQGSIGTIDATWQFLPTAGSGPYYARTYIRFDAFTASGESTVAVFVTGSTGVVYATIDSSGILRLYDENGLVGTAGSALNTGTFYRIELEFKGGVAGSDIAGLYVDGTQIVRATDRSIVTTVSEFRTGCNCIGVEADTTIDLYVDDVAINDSTGGAQTGLPGAGSVVYPRPNADGDADTGTPTRGGTDSGAIWSQMEEIPPNDGDYVVLPTNPSDAIVACDDAATLGIGSSDTITLVEVHGRIRGASTSAANWIPQIESQAAGTRVSGSTVAIASATFQTNDDTAGSRQAKLVSYVDPQAGGAWTPALLDTMQIAARTTDGNPDTWVSALWAVIEYVPAAPPASMVPRLPGARFTASKRRRF